MDVRATQEAVAPCTPCTPHRARGDRPRNNDGPGTATPIGQCTGVRSSALSAPSNGATDEGPEAVHRTCALYAVLLAKLSLAPYLEQCGLGKGGLVCASVCF